MRLSPQTQILAGEITGLRRSLHRMPEKGLEECRTQRFLLDYLDALGIMAKPVAGTGVKAVIDGVLPGPVTALRADMDALNVAEQTACGFESEFPGWMHACGHDGHMAILLCVARLLAERREQVRGQVVLLFQPCEELVTGAARMIGEGVLDSPPVERIFAMHLMPHLPEGTIGVVSGPVMAAACEFRIEIRGKGAHGAMPHLGVDAVTAASQFVCNAQTVVSRGKPPEAPGLLTFGRLVAGKRHNIIADSAILEGTLRAYSDDVLQGMRDGLTAHLKGLEQAWGVSADFQQLEAVPVTMNDGDLAGLALSLYPEACVPAAPLMVAEDFSRYCLLVPGFMGLLGCRCESAGFTEPLHSPRFNFNENALLAAVEFYKRLLID